MGKDNKTRKKLTRVNKRQRNKNVIIELELQQKNQNTKLILKRKIASVENCLEKITQSEERMTKAKNDQSADNSYRDQTWRSQHLVCVPEHARSDKQKHKKKDMQFSVAH